MYSHEESSVVTVVAGCERYGHCVATAVQRFSGFIVRGAETLYLVPVKSWVNVKVSKFNRHKNIIDFHLAFLKEKLGPVPCFVPPMLVLVCMKVRGSKKGSTAMLATKRSAGVAPEVDQRKHFMQMTKHISQGSTPTLRPRTNITQSQKQGYHLPKKKGYTSSNNSKIELVGHIARARLYIFNEEKS